MLAGTPAERSRRAPRIGALLGIVGLAGGGAVFGAQLGHWIKRQGAGRGGHLMLDGWEQAFLAIICVLALHVILLAHELGHLLGGRLVGFRAFLLVVGPMRLERGDGGWRLHLNRSAALWGGLAGSAPTDARNLRARSAVMIAAGPLASLLAGVAFLALCWSLDPAGLGPTTPFLRVAATFASLTAGGASLAIMVATLLPLRTSGYLSDGARLLRLRSNGAAAMRDTALQTIIGQSLAGVRPRDWNSALIADALQVDDNSPFQFTAWQLAQLQALDLGQDSRAQELLERMLANVVLFPRSLHAGVHLEAARQLALRGEIEAAEKQLAMASGTVIGAPFARPLAEATLLYARGQHADAVHMLPQIRVQLADSIDRGGALMLLESVDRIAAGLLPAT